MTWRLLIEDGVDAAAGLAVDDTLARRVGDASSVPTLRLYTYRPHVALVGRFQDVHHEIRVEDCERHGIAINRRPTGGGAIIMGPDQLGLALTLPGRGSRRPARPRELMADFSRGLTRGLAALGVACSFRGKNDLEVGGRKLAGLGLHRAEGGGLLFHASVLVDFDFSLMTRVLKTPFEKTTDKEIATLAERTTTMCRELEDSIAMDDVRRQIAIGFGETFGVTIVSGELDAAERRAAAELETGLYADPGWIFAPGSVIDASGTFDLKTPSGLLRVTVSMAGPTIKALHVRGDFFASANALAHLEGSLRWHSADPQKILRTVEGVRARHPADLGALESDDLVRSIVGAVKNARSESDDSDPYGCFVTPEAARAGNRTQSTR